MFRFSNLPSLARPRLTSKRLLLAAAAAAGLVTVGGEGISYLATMTNMVKDGVSEKIPLEFELQRARTMIGNLVPDIKKNMIVIAREEVSVESLRDELDEVQSNLDTQREEILTLRQDVQNRSGDFRIGNRPANADEVREELKRRFSRYRMAEATYQAKQELLTSRETSLAAARAKLEDMLNAKQDLEVDVENLEARLRTVQRESATSKVDFDESQLARCQQLVDDLHIRLQVAERLLATNGEMELLPSSMTMADDDILSQIDGHFSDSVSNTAIAAKD
jgi:chromosome segregation ATPase